MQKYDEVEFCEETMLWWPKFEARKKAHYDYHTRHLKDLDYSIGLSQGKGLCIQAGGNVGIWPQYLSPHYENVLSFEPDPALYNCLVRNCRLYKNVAMSNYALGSKFDNNVPFLRTGASGTGHIADDQKVPTVTVSVIDLDSYGFWETPVKALFLDVEGYEVEVLKGAIKLIATHKPLIHIELLERCKEEIHSCLTLLNYQLVKRFGKDGVYLHTDNLRETPPNVGNSLLNSRVSKSTSKLARNHKMGKLGKNLGGSSRTPDFAL